MWRSRFNFFENSHTPLPAFFPINFSLISRLRIWHSSPLRRFIHTIASCCIYRCILLNSYMTLKERYKQPQKVSLLSQSFEELFNMRIYFFWFFLRHPMTTFCDHILTTQSRDGCIHGVDNFIHSWNRKTCVTLANKK